MQRDRKETDMAKNKADVSDEGKKKDKKGADSAKKQNAIAKWFKDLKLELSKVIWPKKETVVNNSIVVFAAMIGFAILTFLLDNGFLWLFQFAIGSKS